MTVHPRLVRSVPFWILIVGSAAAIGGGAYVLVDKLGNMETTILDGSATGVDVYVGQVWGVFGGILVGAGVIGLALALAVASARTLVPRPVVESPAPAEHHDIVAETAPASPIGTPAVDTSPTATPSTAPATRAAESSATPASEESSATPASEEPSATPASEESSATPASEESSATPATETPADAPQR